MPRTAITLAAAAVLALLAPAVAAAAFVPAQPGFEDSPLVTGLTAPSAVRFAPEPDGRIFVAEKSGVVKVFDEPLDPTPTEVVDLREHVHDFWDRGLLGMALDPDFADDPSKRRLWLLYTHDRPPPTGPPRWNDACPSPPGPTTAGCVVSGRLVRVTLDPLGRASALETVVEHEWCAQFPSHTVGTVAFGPDGMLYVSAGDGAAYNKTDWGQFSNPAGGTPVNPCGDAHAGGGDLRSEGGALRSQDARTPGDEQGLEGAIVRIDPRAVAGDGSVPAIVAYGMRNPFRFTFRPGRPELWVGDVGWSSHEEINRVDVGGSVENLGWPCFEGPARRDWFERFELCSKLEAGDVTPPAFSYAHGTPMVPGDGCGTGGSSISGLAFHGDDGYPEPYDGALFFADYSRSCIWSMRMGPDGRPDPATREVFARAARGGAVDLQIGPGGDLVYVHLEDGEVRRISYDRPIARLTADRTEGIAPLEVEFSAARSTAPGNGSLTYEWDLDGDGSFTPGDQTETMTYEDHGTTVTARLRVTDGEGARAVDAVTIRTGRPPRDVRVLEPAVPPRWSVGDAIELEGTAVDDDPGDTLELTWTVTMRHCVTGGGCHSHIIQSMTGPAASFTAPDHEYPSHLEVRLSATDDLGATRSAPVLRLDPRTFTMRVGASPAWLAVDPFGDQTVIAGSSVSLSAPTPQSSGGETYRFMGWNDGDRRPQRTVVVRRDSAFVARFLSPPGAVSPPVVSGRAAQGRVLAGTAGAWRGNELVHERRWLRCDTACTVIPGATTATYRPVAGDLGRRLRLEVTARNGLGAAVARSAPTAVVVDAQRPALRLRFGDGRLRLRAACPGEHCRLHVRAVIRIPGRRAMRLPTVTRRLRRGRTASVAPRVSRARRAVIANALRAGTRVTVRWKVGATDAAGNRSRASRIVRLRR